MAAAPTTRATTARRSTAPIRCAFRRAASRCSARCCASTSTTRQTARCTASRPRTRIAGGGGEPEILVRGLRNPWRWIVRSDDRRCLDRRCRSGRCTRSSTCSRPAQLNGTPGSTSAWAGRSARATTRSCPTRRVTSAAIRLSDVPRTTGMTRCRWSSATHANDGWHAIIGGQVYRGRSYPGHGRPVLLHRQQARACLVEATATTVMGPSWPRSRSPARTFPSNPASIHADAARRAATSRDTHGNIFQIKAGAVRSRRLGLPTGLSTITCSSGTRRARARPRSCWSTAFSTSPSAGTRSPRARRGRERERHRARPARPRRLATGSAPAATTTSSTTSPTSTTVIAPARSGTSWSSSVTRWAAASPRTGPAPGRRGPHALALLEGLGPPDQSERRARHAHGDVDRRVAHRRAKPGSSRSRRTSSRRRGCASTTRCSSEALALRLAEHGTRPVDGGLRVEARSAAPDGRALPVPAGTPRPSTGRGSTCPVLDRRRRATRSSTCRWPSAPRAARTSRTTRHAILAESRPHDAAPSARRARRVARDAELIDRRPVDRTRRRGHRTHQPAHRAAGPPVRHDHAERESLADLRSRARPCTRADRSGARRARARVRRRRSPSRRSRRPGGMARRCARDPRGAIPMPVSTTSSTTPSRLSCSRARTVIAATLRRELHRVRRPD